jgi:hypothetical protein
MLVWCGRHLVGSQVEIITRRNVDMTKYVMKLCIGYRHSCLIRPDHYHLAQKYEIQRHTLVIVVVHDHRCHHHTAVLVGDSRQLDRLE